MSGSDGAAMLREALVEIKSLRTRLDAYKTLHEPIAVVGIGCRFPGQVTDPDSFWRLLSGGQDAVVRIPPQRWVPREDGEPGARWAGLLDLEPLQGFDAAFFGVSPREAESLDPQQRLLMEVAWEALERAGIPPQSLHDSATGVFIGMCFQDYEQRVHALDPHSLDVYHTTGTLASVAAGRLSYVLGLRGPALVVDTACASSLVAVHLAVTSLRQGECDLALAGGVNLLLSPDTMEDVARLQALSPDGRCRTFDALANGFVRGEGCGIVVLKRLSAAVHDGDPVLAVLRGTAVNQDGRSTGLTAPNVRAQETLLRQALQASRLAPEAIGYVEAHGTGTSLGDPIEFEALRAVLGAPRSDGTKCPLGSVKTNFGHTEGAAGVAGLIKTVLMLQHEAIAPHLNFTALNPRIRLDGTPFVIPTEPQPWPRGGKLRVAGVSSFGLSGTNAHVVVEEAPPLEGRPAPQTRPLLLPLSARSLAALQVLAARWGAALQAPGARPADLVYTAAVRRGADARRLAVVGTGGAGLAEGLQAAAQNQSWPGLVVGDVPADGRPRIVFVFPGQGSQWAGMGCELLTAEPAFAARLRACDEAIAGETGWSVVGVLQGAAGAPSLDDIDVVQPVLFAVQVALAALWMAWGVVPDGVVGHSMGEIAAAHVAGALTLPDAARIVCRRSRLLRKVRGQGAMAVVELSMDQALRRLEGLEDRLAVAVSNSPRSTVLSGAPEALDALLVGLEAEGVFCRRIKVDVASHSPQMDPLRGELEAALEGLRPQAAARVFHSTVTAGRLEGEHLDAAYWVRNLRDPVQFSAVVADVQAEQETVFVEVSPHPILLPALEGALLPGSHAIGSLRRGQPEQRTLLEALGSAFVAGAAVDWTCLYPHGVVQPAPTYPWQRQRYWIEASGPRRSPGAHPLLGTPRSLASHPGTRVWETELSLAGLPWLGDHRVGGACVVPGTVFLCMALDLGDPLTDVRFEAPLVLDDAQPRLVQVQDDGAWQIHAREADGTWTLHARGARGDGGAGPAEDLDDVRRRCVQPLDVDAFYAHLAQSGARYGPAFQGLVALQGGDGECLGRVRSTPSPYRLHPAVLDAALQVLWATQPAEGLLVPVSIQSVRLDGAPESDLWVYARGRRTPHGLEGDVWGFDASGKVCVEVRGVRCRPLSSATPAAAGAWRVEWRPDEGEPSPSPGPGRWRVLTDEGGVGAELCTWLRNAGGDVTLGGPLDVGDGQAVVDLRGLDAPSGSAPQDLVAALSRVGGSEVPKVWLVTRGAQLGAEPAAWWGQAWALAVEQPAVRITLVDLSPGDAQAARWLAGELRRGGRDDLVALGPEGRRVARLVWASPAGEEAPAGDAQVLSRLLDREGFDPRQWLQSHPHLASSTFLSAASSPGRGRPRPDLPLSAAERPQAVERIVRGHLARILRLDADAIDARAPFKSLGLDSLMGLELRNRLEASLGLTLSGTLVWAHPTLARLVAGLLPLLEAAPARRDAARASRPEAAASGAIAVIGMACRLPGAVDSPEAFWTLLCGGADPIQELPPSLRSDRADAPRFAGLLPRSWLEEFDAGFFGIAGREASSMDPQQRLLLEVAWEALEGAGQAPDALEGSPTGVFVGACNLDYKEQVRTLDPQDRDAYCTTGNTASVAAGRISYVLGLQGPCTLVDTACSSSLVALHLAVNSLRRGECTLALVGGVNLVLSAEMMMDMARTQALAADGHCRTFDARAGGMGRSEGCVMVVLKPLEAARRDRDPILAVVRGSAMNHDGRSSGLTAPNVLAQQAVLRQALQDAGVAAEAIDHVEAHGTGTPLGDPIEVEALAAVLGQPRADGSQVVLGAGKSCVGHTEAAAGVTGLVKLVLSMQHERVPAVWHFETLNPVISLEGTSLVVADRPHDWRRGERPRLAGVSSFGMSGTNVHVVVEEGPPPPEAAAGPASLLVLSARDEETLSLLAARWAEWLQTHPEQAFADVCHTAAVGRSSFAHRLAVVATTGGVAAAALSTAPRGVAKAPPRVAFLFTGQGAQAPGIGRRLYDTHPVFRAAVDRGAALLAPLPLLELLDTDAIHQTGHAQPALFVLEYALASLWRSWGIEPVAVLGHSIGELAAACVAGVFGFEDGVALVSARGRLMQELPAGGGMASVRCDRATLERHRGDLEVSLAALNGPSSLVVSGAGAALDELCARLAADGVETRRLTVSHAFHSRLMEPMMPAFEAVVRGLALTPPSSMALISNLGGAVAGSEVATAEYWVRHVREPVAFEAGMRALEALGVDALVEIGPHPVLLGMGAECIAMGDRVWLPSLRRGQDDTVTMLESLGRLWVRGAAVEWAAVDGGRQPRKVTLPPSVFQRQRYWLPPGSPPTRRPVGGHPLLGEAVELAGQGGTTLWDCTFGVSDVPWLRDHAIDQAVVLPGAAWLEMALHAARTVWGPVPVMLEGVEFREALVVSDQPCRVQVLVTLDSPAGGRFRASSRQPDGSWQVHVTAHLSMAPGAVDAEAPPSHSVARMVDGETAGAFYARLARHGLNYGPAFQRVHQVWTAAGEAMGAMDAPAVPAGGHVHPALLDACFHVLMAAVPEALEQGPMVPVEIRRVRFQASPAEGRVWSHGWAALAEDGHLTGTVRVLGEDGSVCLEVEGLQGRPLGTRVPPVRPWWHVAWERAEAREAENDVRGRWILVGDGGLAAPLRARLEARGATVVEIGAAAGDLLDSAPCRGIVCLAGLEVPPVPDGRGEELGCAAVLTLVQGVSRMRWREAPSLWLVSRGAQPAGDEPVTATQGVLWGFGRTLAIEHPELCPVRVDLPSRASSADVDLLWAELLRGGDEDEVALRSAGRYGARLLRGAPESPRPPLARAASYRVWMDRPGVLDDLGLRAQDVPSPGPGEVLIAVEAAGLNFKDVVLALGLLPASAVPTGLSLGLECCGRVVSYGEGVQGLEAGQLVMALTPGSLSSHVVAPAVLTVPAPAGLTAEEAASLCAVQLTAYHALQHVARLQPGERVLIHAGAGGVGQAAIQWARHLGAEVYTTAGSAEKRAWLEASGVRYVSDSRSFRFVDDVLAWTGGEGVDVVLNSLAGPFLEKSLGLLRDKGRFVELGMRDGLANTPIGLKPFLRNLSFSLVDLTGLMKTEPQRVRTVWEEVLRYVEAGVLRPLPRQTMPVAEAAQAFRMMAQGQHRGKIVLTFGASAAEVRPMPRSSTLDGAGTHLITGGTGGLGWRLAQWLVGRGVRHLVLISRQGSRPAGLAEVEAQGVRVLVAAADVADRTALQGVLDTVRATWPPLRGVFHAAGVVDDATIGQQSPERLHRVMAPKILGAWNLHDLTRDDPLQCFVAFSSVTSLLGSAGQSNYTAANAFLDGLAWQRHGEGRPALTVNWGPFLETGMAMRAEQQGSRQLHRGLSAMTPDEGWAALAEALSGTMVQVGLAAVNLRQWLEFNPQMAGVPRLSRALQESGPAAATASMRQLLLEAPAEARAGRVEAFVRQEAVTVLRVDPARVQRDTPFKALGLDSLMGLELRNRLEAALGLKLPASLLWTYSHLGGLAEFLTEAVGGLDAPSPPAVDEGLEDIRKLSSSEKDALLESAWLQVEGA